MATTFTIDDKKIEKKYSPSELKMKFLSFLKTEGMHSKIELFEVDYDDLSPEAKHAYDNRHKMKFIER